MLTAEDFSRIARYVWNDGPVEEREAVRVWIEASGERTALADQMARVRQHAPESSTAYDSHAGWARFRESVGVDGDHPHGSRRRPRVMGPWGSRHVGLGVATLAVMVWGGIALWHSRHVSEYVTRAGQRETVHLPDGTVLTLAPETRVWVAGDYGRQTREIILEGEAYFAVRHDAAHPFTVHAGDAEIRDIGTAFDVRRYPEDSGVRVAVVEGQVAVNTVAAKAGEVLVTVGRQVARQEGLTMAPLTAWMQGSLVFDKAPLREVVRDISRTFGVTVTVADSTLLTRRITATLSGESLNVVLNIVTQVVGARFEMTNHGVVIQSKPVDARQPDKGHPNPLTTVQATLRE